MRTCLFSMDLRAESMPFIRALIDAVHEVGIVLYRHTATEGQEMDSLPVIHSTQDLADKKIDCILAAGGDGTMLKAAAFAGKLQIPLLGLNLGRLGFLAVVEKDEIKSMAWALKAQEFTIERRTTLKMISSPDVFDQNVFALNDFTLVKRDNSSMIRIHTMLNGEFLNTYWADGLILATPTGSTGYSLACGGPIVFPQSSNFVLTPIAPHNLNVRPIVISDDSVLEFNVEGRTDTFLCTMDSYFGQVTSEHQIILRKNDFDINLIRLEGYTFLKTLRKKLMWGLDQRN